MQNILLISVGAVIGANLRYFVAQYVARAIPSTLPYGTFIIHFTASLLLVFCCVDKRTGHVDPRWRIFVAIGFCGSYSTYSSFAFETFALFEKGHCLGAALNIAGTNVLCFAAVIIGAAVAMAL